MNSVFIEGSRTSSLLNRSEHLELVNLLGPKCQSLATSVVQLFITDGPDHSAWRRRDAGIICFVKDYANRSYYFRLFCLTRQCLVWEQEVYKKMAYRTPKPWFHTFEVEYAVAALNFPNEDEAESFKLIVLKQLKQKYIRGIDRKSRARQIKAELATGIKKSERKHHIKANASKPRITKEEIGMPYDLKHVSHVGWGLNNEFEIYLDEIEDANLKRFFEKAGVSNSLLKDSGTRKIIYDFLKENGGMDAINKELDPPDHSTQMVSQATTVCQTLESQQEIGPPQTAANTGFSAPPPPPMPDFVTSSTSPGPTMTNQNEPSAGSNDHLSALLNDFKSGTSLKHIEVKKKSIPDCRNELMGQIREGIALKAVQPIDKSKPPVQSEHVSLSDILRKVLEERRNVIHNIESGSDDDDGLNEWLDENNL